MKCDELKDYDYDPNFPFQSRGRFYVADEVDAAIAELKCELRDVLDDAKSSREMITELQQKLHDIDNQWNEQCKEIVELKAKLESVQATAYADSVDTGMRERRLRRALWLMKARYFWILMVYASDLAKVANPSIIHKSNFIENLTPRCMEEYQYDAELYDNARIKCLKKAEEYK